MPNSVYIGFDFGMRRIGVAVGQTLTGSASPLPTLEAKAGVPQWHKIQALITVWHPKAFIVGLPKTIDDKALYTTASSRHFAEQLHQQFSIPVHLVDERLTTVEARSYLFAAGGYRKIKQTAVDSIAACIILEQWLQHRDETR